MIITVTARYPWTSIDDNVTMYFRNISMDMLYTAQVVFQDCILEVRARETYGLFNLLPKYTGGRFISPEFNY